jgi:hypothetical protein
MNHLEDKIKIFFLFCIIQLNAQSLKPYVISNASTIFSDNQSKINFSLGEIGVFKLTDENGYSLGGGFINSYVEILNIEEPLKEIIDVVIFPNPSYEIINLHIKETKLENFIIEIFDPQGKKHLSNKYTGKLHDFSINISNFSTGTYLLKLLSLESKTLGIYKIIKN